jgi:glycosyltransferase involved in cell wall biosynthesis
MMRLTVILCTYNRSHSLARTLDSLAVSSLPNSVEWEVVVVDNNSNDQTRDVVTSFCRRFPGRFRYLHESMPGKSYALNAGIRVALGDILAFVDDDVTVEARWLQNLTVTLLHDETWVGSGGRTVADQSFSPPPWLSIQEPYNSGGILAALFDLGEEACALDRPPYGTNMAYRRSMFEKYGGFRIDLGPSPHTEIPRPNEDTEFGRRLMAAGERLRYEPSAIVYHPIVEDRVRKGYFLAWWFDFGRAGAREWKDGPALWRVPRPYISIVRTGITRTIPGIGHWLFSREPVGRFYFKCQVWKTAGWIAEMYRRSARKTITGGSSGAINANRV